MRNMFNTDIEFGCGYDIEETPVGEVERYCSKILTEYVLPMELVDKDGLTKEEKDLKFDLECEFEDIVLDDLSKYGDWIDIYKSLMESILDATCSLVGKHNDEVTDTYYYIDNNYSFKHKYYIKIDGKKIEK